MAHMIMEDDTVMVTGRQSWHGLSIVVDTAQSSSDALRIANLDWEVFPKDVYADNSVIPGYKANARSDTGQVLGIVSDRYRVCQNKDAFSFVDDILANSQEVKFHSAGSLENGKRVFMMAELPQGILLGTHVQNFMFFSNAHDGKNGIKVGLTNTVIECNNTLNLALADSPRTWSTKHIGDIEAKKHEAMKTLQFASAYMEGTKALAEEMYSKKISKTDLDNFLNLLFPMEEEGTDREKNNIAYCRNNILDIYMGKDDLANFRGTAWGLYNATADFVSNTKPVRTTKTYREKLFASFLDGNVVLQQAQKILMAA